MRILASVNVVFARLAWRGIFLSILMTYIYIYIHQFFGRNLHLKSKTSKPDSKDLQVHALKTFFSMFFEMNELQNHIFNFCQRHLFRETHVCRLLHPHQTATPNSPLDCSPFGSFIFQPRNAAFSFGITSLIGADLFLLEKFTSPKVSCVD